MGSVPNFSRPFPNTEESDLFAEELVRALDHLYDLSYLETSPLARRLSGEALSRGQSRGKALRMTIMDAIQALHPPEGTPANDPAWRPYRILEGHYIAGMSRQELEGELCLSKTQYYRERGKALEALHSILWRDLGGATGQDFSPDPALDELRRVAQGEQLERLDLRALVQDVMGLLSPTLSEIEVTLRDVDIVEGIWVKARPGLLRQGILILCSKMLQTIGPGMISIRGEIENEQVMLCIEAERPFRSEIWREVEPMANAFFREAGVEACLKLSRHTMRIALGAPDKARIVLLVDNNPDLADLFRLYLEGENWSLVHAASVKEAMTICRTLARGSSPLSLILLDVLMPGQDGWHLLAQLKRLPEVRDIPIVICSVLDQPRLALSLGASGYLRKPVSRAQLLATLHRWEDVPAAEGRSEETERPEHHAAGASPGPRPNPPIDTR